MLRLSDFVTCRKRYNNQSGGVYISASEHGRKMKFRTNLHLTLISKIVYVVMVDFVVWSTSIYIWSSGSIAKV